MIIGELNEFILESNLLRLHISVFSLKGNVEDSYYDN